MTDPRLVIDPTVAEDLVEMTGTRCLVLAARHAHQLGGTVCVSPYECCACAMPATTYKRACELCGRTVFRPARKRV